VIAPANTGNDRSYNQAVINTDQTNSGRAAMLMPGARMFITVVMILMEPIKLDTPATCRLKIDKSTAAPRW
jgi:hypothetical protein